MKLAIVLFIAWALLSGCDYDTKVGAHLQTKDGARYGVDWSLSQRNQQSHDGKTMLSPHYPQAAPTPAPEKKGWWPF